LGARSSAARCRTLCRTRCETRRGQNPLGRPSEREPDRSQGMGGLAPARLAGLPWQQRSHLQRPIVRDRCDVPRHESDRTGPRRICLSTKVAPDLRGQKPSWPAVCSQSGARQTSLPVPRRALDGAKDRERESADRGGAAAEIGYPDADTVPEIPAPIVDPDGGAPGSDPDQKSCILRTLSFCTRASSEACGKEFQGAASARRQQTSSGPLTFS